MELGFEFLFLRIQDTPISVLNDLFLGSQLLDLKSVSVH